MYRQVLLTLVLLRQNLNQAAAGDLFGISQSSVSRIWRRMLPLLEQVTCLHAPGELAELARGRVVLVDGTDVPTGNRAVQGNFSGKRHRAGLNIQIAATLEGTLLAVSDPCPGAAHDRRAITDTGWEAILDDPKLCWIADPGYQGTTAPHPTKKPRRSELSQDRKDVNRTISAVRSAVERAIAHLKNWKILATGYRGPLRELPNVIRIVTRLEYFRLGW